MDAAEEVVPAPRAATPEDIENDPHPDMGSLIAVIPIEG